MSHDVATTARKAMRWLEGKFVYSAGFGVVLMLATGAGLFYYYRAQENKAQVVRVGYGAGGPVRRHFLEQIAAHGKDVNLDIQLVVTEGTADTVARIEKHDTELGLITGAIEDPATGGLFEIMPLYMEPLQLLVREPLYEAVSKDFGQLRNKTIALDSAQSATNLVATELMNFIGLIDRHGTRHFTPVYLQQPELVAITDPARLPDAIFQIAGLPSPTIRHMVTTHNYKLVPLPFGSSFNLEKFRQADAPDLFDRTNLRLDRAFIEEFVIPAFSYSVLPPVPPEDTRTIASRLLLVAGRDVDPRTVRKILDLVLSPEVSELARPPLSVELLDHAYQFERHAGTHQYLESLRPLDVESAFDNYGRIVEIWGLIIAGYVAASRGLRSWRQRKTVTRKSVGDFMVEVLAVEAEAAPSCSRDDRTQLDQRLTDIKRTALEMHLEETLDNAESLPALLVTVADARTRIWGPAP